MNAHQKTPLVYNGHLIADKGDDLCLTDMWKSCGSPANKEPWNWTRKEGSSFVAAVALGLNLPHSQVIKAKKGKGGSTFAHWQAGMAYAQYLDHDFHMWCNTAAREKMEGKLPSALPDDIVELLRRDDGMIKQVIHKVTVMQKQHVELVERLAEMEDRIQSPLTCTAHDMWTEFNLAPCKGGTVWLGNRLIEMGCSPEFGSRSKIGASWRRQFDAGRARVAMRNGLYLLAKRHIDERQGQGKLRLVQRE